ncbi:MAG: ABC transporter permease subunit [Magnetococcales bacterium]|nr:ABC transporter permease subunit [Magnetococcales bacterium]
MNVDQGRMPFSVNLGIRMISLAFAIVAIPVLPIFAVTAGTDGAQYIMAGTLALIGEQGDTASGPVLYWRLLNRIIHLDFGVSLTTGAQVLPMTLEALRVSLGLIGFAVVIAMLTGFVGGLIAVRPDAWRWGWKMIGTVLSVPVIVLSYLVLYAFDTDMMSTESTMMIAAWVLAAYPTTVLAMNVARSIRSLKATPFYVNHRAQGFSERHTVMLLCIPIVIKNMLIAVPNIIAYFFGFLVFVEAPFGINGIGTTFLYAVKRFDYPLIIGISTLTLVLLTLVMIIVEAGMMLLDPRLRTG